MEYDSVSKGDLKMRRVSISLAMVLLAIAIVFVCSGFAQAQIRIPFNLNFNFPIGDQAWGNVNLNNWGVNLGAGGPYASGNVGVPFRRGYDHGYGYGWPGPVYHQEWAWNGHVQQVPLGDGTYGYYREVAPGQFQWLQPQARAAPQAEYYPQVMAPSEGTYPPVMVPQAPYRDFPPYCTERGCPSADGWSAQVPQRRELPPVCIGRTLPTQQAPSGELSAPAYAQRELPPARLCGPTSAPQAAPVAATAGPTMWPASVSPPAADPPGLLPAELVELGLGAAAASKGCQ
jgi:hypothetical protein